MLTDEIKSQIIQLTSEKKSLKEISDILQISIPDLKEQFKTERQERLLRKAEKDSEEILDIDMTDPELLKKYGEKKLLIMKLKQSESQFIRETLGKDQGYSKRSEITGKNGEEIRIGQITFNAPLPNKVKSDNASN